MKEENLKINFDFDFYKQPLYNMLNAKCGLHPEKIRKFSLININNRNILKFNKRFRK